MISENDLAKVQESINNVKEARDKGIKARVDLVLESGKTLSIYHLGQSNNTIRLDLKL